ncbi:uncharacterized protein LOC111278336 [Durio zibethinus]|uniref:Uncharacterized protein LOC111278336 n=1 Tax=Durio zibethinus TaxID=66656 RepID=A0A6P5WXY8_DURZI|nr:uncharacterized protein LOC111278336 [Durio zibethinus]
MSYAELYPLLLENYLIAPIPAEPRKPPFPECYDPNARCEYHFGIIGHSLENCTALKHRVQGLMKAGYLSFDTKMKPVIHNNPSLIHVKMEKQREVGVGLALFGPSPRIVHDVFKDSYLRKRGQLSLHTYSTRASTIIMENEGASRMDRVEKTQGEIGETVTGMQQNVNRQLTELKQMIVELTKGKEVVETYRTREETAVETPLYLSGFTYVQDPHVSQTPQTTDQPYIGHFTKLPSVQTNINPGHTPHDFTTVPNVDDHKKLKKLKRVPDPSEDIVMKDKYDLLEGRLKAIESHDVYENVDANELSLVPDLIIPSKFKALNFEKYNETGCPKIHLAQYCHKMFEKQSNSYLERFITGILEAIPIYVGVSSGSINPPKYEKEPNESYKEYAVRWKNMASQVQPPLTNRELNSLFVDTLPSPYYDKIEDGIRRGRIINTGDEKRGDIFAKQAQEIIVKGQNERNLTMMQEDPTDDYSQWLPYCPQPIFTIDDFPRPLHLYAQIPSPRTEPRINLSHSQSRKRKRAKVYHSLSIPYAELFTLLIENHMISVVPARPRKPPYPKWYDPNAKCEFHDGVKGHSIEDCTAFKDKVQALIDADAAKFKELVGGFDD